MYVEKKKKIRDWEIETEKQNQRMTRLTESGRFKSLTFLNDDKVNHLPKGDPTDIKEKRKRGWKAREIRIA